MPSSTISACIGSPEPLHLRAGSTGKTITTTSVRTRRGPPRSPSPSRCRCFPARSIARREVGPSAPIPPCTTSTKRVEAATSPPGSSRTCSVPNCARPSVHYANPPDRRTPKRRTQENVDGTACRAPQPPVRFSVGMQGASTMKVRHSAVAIAAGLALGLTWFAYAGQNPRSAAPIYGVTLPDGYRDWPLVAPAQEAAQFDELRVVVGNPTAMRAYRKNTRPFPDGTVLVKLAWKREPSPDFASASVPGSATTVQVMVKDSKRYATT